MGRIIFFTVAALSLIILQGIEYYRNSACVMRIVEIIIIVLMYIMYFVVNKSNDNCRVELGTIARQKEELERAKVLQNKIFAPIEVDDDDIVVRSKYKPYMDIGGDFHDFKKIGEGKWLFYIGDFSGHGISAGIVSFFTKIFIDNLTKETDDIVEITKKINKSFLETRGMEGYFLTMLIGILDLENNIVEYISCGNPIPLKMDISGRVEKLFDEERNSFILGMLDDITLRKNSFSFTRGESILFFTDGVAETMDEFKLKEMMRKGSNVIGKAIETVVPKDDMTFIHIIRN